MVALQKIRKLPNPICYTLTIVLLLLSIFGIIIICVIWCYANEIIYSYGIIVDAGSTSTKIYLYKWPEIATRTNGEVTEVEKCKSAPGISDFLGDPAEAVTGIEFCIEREITPKIPKRLRNKTFIYLGATAGMRLIEQRNPVQMKLIFEAVEGYLLSTGYKMKRLLEDVKVISGTVEGMAAWITVNYLKNTLQKNIFSKTTQDKTFGALDLGGASTQITFVPNSPQSKMSLTPIRLYGKDYEVYSHSYLCYGKSQAEFRLLALLSENWITGYNSQNPIQNILNPCMLVGDSSSYMLQDIITIPCVAGDYARNNFGFGIQLPESVKNKNINLTFIGTGDPDQCQIIVKKLFSNKICTHGTCGFNNIYQPKLSDKYLAFAGYNVVYRHLQNNSDSYLSYSGFQSKAKDYCRMKPPAVEIPISQRDKEIENFRKWRCFGLLYVYQLLTNLGFNESNWQSITFTNSVNKASLGWSLGYMINKTSMIPIEKPILNLKFGTFIAILLIFLVTLFIACIFAIISFKLYCLTKRTSKPSENLKLNSHDNYYEELPNHS